MATRVSCQRMSGTRKSSADRLHFPKIMGCGYHALKDGDWQEYKSIFKVEISATGWAFERIRRAFEKVAKDEAGSLNIVQRIMLKSTDFLQRVIAPAGGRGGVTLSYLLAGRPVTLVACSFGIAHFPQPLLPRCLHLGCGCGSLCSPPQTSFPTPHPRRPCRSPNKPRASVRARAVAPMCCLPLWWC